ncbi:3-oxoadipate enol-lactonase [Sphingomonas palmae]|uniref:3-oxoadipate enol-lactonase n=1 Tax=Sphingomonas palmae TaxID=1855283 RepID=A0A1H7T3U3_9SPHN|nr:alpha/beta fold hydrolase [Sphingomonas palmae]SEL79159.1 3-oxoadipate enol-lactonase [Sphingomonas palmae]
MFEEGTAVAADGTKLFYTRHGRGPAHIVLTHSLGMTGEFWRPVLDRLRDDEITVLTWDCRGHGRSDKPAGPYSVEQFADDLNAVLDAAGWPDAVVAGASMGGCVTLAFAIRHSKRVTALGLFDTTATYGATAPADWAERASKAASEGLASLTSFQQTRWFSDDFRAQHPDVVEACVEVFRANDVGAFEDTCRMLGAVDLTSGLSTIHVPTTILVGEEDYATPPAMAEVMHTGIPGSTLEVISGARHLTPIECPEVVASRLLALAQGDVA